MAEADLVISLFLMLFVIMILGALIIWQRKYYALLISRLKNRQIGNNVRIVHKDRTYTDYTVPSVKDFNWKKGGMSKLFENLPDWLNQTQIPNIPYLRDRRTGFGSYEFNEDSKQCIDPMERQPDLSMLEADSNDKINAFEQGRKWERLKSGSQFNKLLVILLVVNILLGVGGIIVSNQIKEGIDNFKKQVDPIIEKANELVSDPTFPNNLFRGANNGGNVVGQVVVTP